MPAHPTELTPGLVVMALFVLAVLAGIVGAWSFAIIRWSLGHRLLPSAPLRAVPWGVLAILTVVLLRFVIQLPLELVFYALKPGALAAMRAGKSPLSPFDQMFLVGLVNLGLVLLIPVALRLISGARAEDLGLPGRPIGLNLLRGAWLCFLLLPVVYGLMLLATRVWSPKQHPAALSLFENPSAASMILTLISAVLLAPAAEELAFRGVLLGWLTRLCEGLPKPGRRADDPLADPLLDATPAVPLAQAAEAGLDLAEIEASEILTAEPPPAFSDDLHEVYAEPEAPVFLAPIVTEKPPTPPSPAVRALPNIITSALFAVVHWGQWPAPVPLFILALGLGLIYRRTGSLWAPFALHATFNGLSMTAATLAALSGIKPDALPKPAGPGPGVVVAERSTFLRHEIGLGRSATGDYDFLPPDGGRDHLGPRAAAGLSHQGPVPTRQIGSIRGRVAADPRGTRRFERALSAKPCR